MREDKDSEKDIQIKRFKVQIYKIKILAKKLIKK